MRNFLSADDVTNIEELAQKALAIKANPYAYKHMGEHRTLLLVFLNASLRTRLSTQKAAQNMGMHTIVLNVGQDSWQMEYEDGAVMNGTTAEHIKEGAAVMGQYADIVGLRSFPTLTDKTKDYQEYILHNFAKYVQKPVISLESATLHPLQSLTDLMTIREYSPIQRPKVVLSWAPHIKALPQCVANSFAQWMSRADVDFVITHPKGYELDTKFTLDTKIYYDQEEAFENADFIYAKNWSSYSNYGQILHSDASWMITKDTMNLTNNAKFMHCLPVRRNVVVSDEVIDSPSSIVISQAGNREWAAQAVLKEILENL
jgi:N-succinyl-L-ornithine transcarbamylase